MIERLAAMASLAALLAACQPAREDQGETIVNEAAPAAPAPPVPDTAADNAAEPAPNAAAPAADALPPSGARARFVGRWAAEAGLCADTAWRFTERELHTPAGSVCTLETVTQVAGGYDIGATCTAEGPPTRDELEIRFAESAGAMLFESDTIADAGLVYCGAD